MDMIEPLSRSSNLINVDDCFIIIIDVQEAFTQGLTREEQTVFMRKYMHLIKLAYALKIPLIVTAENIQKNGSIPDTLLHLLAPNAHIYDKFIYSCWGQKDIQNVIKNTRKTVGVLCGFETDVCVGQTAIDLLDNEYQVCVLVDMTFSRNLLEHEIGLKRMEHHGVILSALKSWQEEITAGVRTSIHRILKDNNLMNI